MKKYNFYLVTFFLCTIICFTKCRGNNEVKSLHLFVNYPISQVLNNDSLHFFNLKDTVSIYYIKEYIIIKLSAVREMGTEKRILNSEPFFVYKKRDSIGVLYNSITELKEGKLFRVDSILFNRAFTGSDVSILTEYFKKVSTQKKGKVETEKYIPIAQGTNQNEVDTIILTFNNHFLQFDYEMCKGDNILKGRKLVHKQLVFNSQSIPNSHITLPQREISYRIVENKDVLDKRNILKAFAFLK